MTDTIASDTQFFSPALLAETQSTEDESPRGRLLLASCRSGTYLASQVADRYQTLLAEINGRGQVARLADIDFHFSDSETCVRLEQDVSGCDVFLCQGLYDPTLEKSVDQNYMAFLIAARTFKEWGANHITAVLPYLAYARQDKPTKFKREPTTARLLAEFSADAGIDRMVVWHPHQSQVHGFYGRMPVDVLEALPLFASHFRHFEGREEVIAVGPDAGASKFITHFSRALNLRSAIASKYRPQPEETLVSQVIGDFAGKTTAIVLDDMISSGGTIYALIKKLVEEKGIEAVHLGVSHNLCTAQALERLQELHEEYHLQEVVITNSIPQTEAFRQLPFVTIRNLADTLARVINRIHHSRSVTDLFYRE